MKRLANWLLRQYLLLELKHYNDAIDDEEDRQKTHDKRMHVWRRERALIQARVDRTMGSGKYVSYGLAGGKLRPVEQPTVAAKLPQLVQVDRKRAKPTLAKAGAK